MFRRRSRESLAAVALKAFPVAGPILPSTAMAKGIPNRFATWFVAAWISLNMARIGALSAIATPARVTR